MKASNVVMLHNEICALQKVKRTVWEFNRLIIEIKRLIKEMVEHYSESVEAIQKEISELRVQYCKKDSSDNAMISRRYKKDEKGDLSVISEQYVGLVAGEQPEFDKRFEHLNNVLKNLSNGNVEIEEQLKDIKKVKRSQLPKDWDGSREEIFWDFIKENEKKDEEGIVE